MTDTCSGHSSLSTRSSPEIISSWCIPCGGRPDGRSRSVVGSTAMDRCAATYRRPTGYAHTVRGAPLAVVRVVRPFPHSKGSRTRPWPRARVTVLLPTTEKTRFGVTLYVVKAAAAFARHRHRRSRSLEACPMREFASADRFLGRGFDFDGLDKIIEYRRRQRIVVGLIDDCPFLFFTVRAKLFSLLRRH